MRSDPEHGVAITDPHPATVETRARYAGCECEVDGLFRSTGGRGMRLHVSPEGLDRALRLVDALFRGAEARGHTVILTDDGDVRVVVGDESVTVRLREGSERFPHVPTHAEKLIWRRNPYALVPEYDWKPTGELTFEVENVGGARSRWAEGKRWRQEGRIDALIGGIEAAARNLGAEREARERRRREWREQEERRIEGERFRAQLEKEVTAWRLAWDIRSFVEDMRRVAGDDETNRFLAWSLRHADSIDPVSARRRAIRERERGGGDECLAVGGDVDEGPM